MAKVQLTGRVKDTSDSRASKDSTHSDYIVSSEGIFDTVYLKMCQGSNMERCELRWRFDS